MVSAWSSAPSSPGAPPCRSAPVTGWWSCRRGTPATRRCSRVWQDEPARSGRGLPSPRRRRVPGRVGRQTRVSAAAMDDSDPGPGEMGSPGARSRRPQGRLHQGRRCPTRTGGEPTINRPTHREVPARNHERGPTRQVTTAPGCCAGRPAPMGTGFFRTIHYEISGAVASTRRGTGSLSGRPASAKPTK